MKIPLEARSLLFGRRLLTHNLILKPTTTQIMCKKTTVSDPTRPWLDGVKTPLTLVRKEKASHDSNVYYFSLEHSTNDDNKVVKPETFGISVCSCVLVSPPDRTDLVRPYTPISSQHETDYVRLLVKTYPQGNMSKHMDNMEVGKDQLLFWQIPFNIKEQYPFGNRKLILMLAGGTGLTPMYQALLRMFGSDETNELNTRVVLLYGSRTVEDIFLRKEIDAMVQKYPNHLRVVHVLSHEQNDSVFTKESGYEKGFISLDLLQRIYKEETELLSKQVETPLTEDDVRAWVCGPPIFYNIMSGPREEKEKLPEDALLHKLGMNLSQIVKF